MKDKDYIVVVQCDIVKQRCSGYICEQSLHARQGAFSGYDPAKAFRTLYMTCGGCCGRALHRKLAHLARRIKGDEAIERDRIVVHLSSCIAKDNHHGPPCPHLEYLRTLIGRLNMDVVEGTCINAQSQKRREEGTYSS